VPFTGPTVTTARLTGHGAATGRLSPLLRAVDRHRRGLAALTAAVAVTATVVAVRPPPPPTVPVVTATRDLPGGLALRPDDVTVTRWLGARPPAGAMARVSAVAGRVLAGPARRGEPITDVRLVGSRLATALPPGQVAVAVPIADPGVTDLLGAGDRVDILAASSEGPASSAPDGLAEALGAVGPASARTVASDALVLSVPGPATGTRYGGPGPALLLVAVDGITARDLAAAAVASRLSVALRPVATR
jgi:Flp pilus assembly protein CpaB